MIVLAVTLAGMAVLLAARGYFLAPEGWATLAPDEAQRAWHALQVLQGKVIYRDLWVQYTPLSFYWHALVFTILGPSLGAIRMALVATGTLTLGVVALLGRRLGGTAGAMVAGALFLTFGIPTYNSGYPAWEAMLFSVAALAVVLHSRSVPSAMAAGLLVGLSTMAKINVGMLSLLALVTVLGMPCSRGVRRVVNSGTLLVVWCLVRPMAFADAFTQFLVSLAVVLAVTMRQETSRGSARPVGVAVLAWGVVCCGVLAPFAATLGLHQLWLSVIQEPLRFSRLIAYSSPIWKLGPAAYATAACWMAALAVPMILPRRRRLAASAAALGAIPLVLDGIGLIHGITMGLRFLLVPALVSTVALVSVRGAVDPRLITTAVWVALVYVQLYPGQSGMHLAWALVPAWALLVGIVGAAAKNAGRLIWLLPAVLAMAQMMHGLTVASRTEWVALTQQRGKINVPRQDAEELNAVVANLRHDAGVPVLDLTSGCLYAFLTERPCPLRHAYFWRGFLTEDDQRFEVARFAGDPPPEAVRRLRGRDQYRWEAIARYAPIFAQWVDSTYSVTERIGRIEILTLRAPMDAMAGESPSGRTLP